MISKLKLKNFKIYTDIEIELSNLTVLCGNNSCGKSTILQALLMLRQSLLKEDFQKDRLFLGEEDSLVQMGTKSDILNFYAPKSASIIIEIEDNNKKISFTSKELTDNEAVVNENIVLGTWNGKANALKTFSLFSKNFQYLSADRITPQSFYPSGNGSFFGKDGRYAIHYLDKYGDRMVDKNLIHTASNKDQDTLLQQTNFWLSDISKGIIVSTKYTSTTNKVSLSYSYSDKSYTTPSLNPQNVGYGVTYTLPIIVALLAAKSGDLLLIENPEAHLHPKGQISLAMLIALVAQNGVQIILETHSDHIINGILLACKSYTDTHKGIDNKNVVIYQIEKYLEYMNSIFHTIELNENGRVFYPPVDFFDEIGKSRKILMGF